MIRLEGLTKTYGKFVAVDNIDLHVPRGTMFGFVGPNGAAPIHKLTEDVFEESRRLGVEANHRFVDYDTFGAVN